MPTASARTTVLRARAASVPYSEPRYDTSNEDGAPGYLAGFLKKAMEGRLQKPLEFGRNDKKVFEFLQGLPASFKTILWRRAVWYNYIAKLQE